MTERFAYYNEIDPVAAQWLRNLIAAGHIAPGVVDERSIVDVRIEDLRGFKQCHFFAGIGVWSYALRRAGWPDDRPVWTGSCPCQPLSAAGAGAGFGDERHLWPAWFDLIRERRAESGAVVVFGEQVASKDGLAWLDLVHHDLEGEGYTVGAVDLCAAGFGCPGIRQRFFFVADTNGGRCEQRDAGLGLVSVAGALEQSVVVAHAAHGGRRVERDALGSGGSGHHDRGGVAGLVAYPSGAGSPKQRRGREKSSGLSSSGGVGVVGHANGSGCGVERGVGVSADTLAPHRENPDGHGAVNGFWSGADWVWCRDPDGPRWRPVESGTFPLVAGAPARVGRLRAYGNAINAEVAQAFIGAYLDERGLR